MNLRLSEPDENGKRHIILTCTMEEGEDAKLVINKHVLPPGVHNVRRLDQATRTWEYHFAKRFLPKLMLALPEAEICPRIDRHLMHQEAKRQMRLRRFDLDLDGFQGRLHDFQHVGVCQVVKDCSCGHRAFMLLDDMGLGKTVQILAALRHLDNIGADAFPALIICPTSAKWVWERMTHQFLPGINVQVVDGSADQRALQIRQRRADIVVGNIESLRVQTIGRGQHAEYFPANPDYFRRMWATFVFDEFHNVSNPGAQQTTGFLRVRAERGIYLSGTPVVNGKAWEMWPVLHRIDPEMFPNPNNLKERLREKIGVRYHPNVVEIQKVKKFVQKHSLRRRKDQVDKQLPKRVDQTRFVEMSAEQWRIYNEIRDEFRLILESGERLSVPTFLAQLTRLKQACFSPELFGGSPRSAKVDEVKVICRELRAERRKVLIFSQWSRATRIMERELEQFNPAYVDGSVKGRDRMAQVDKFMEDPTCFAYIGSMKANKEAISLGIAKDVILTDKWWNPAAHDQAIARSAAGGLRGQGQRGSVNVITLYTANTVEERIETLLRKKGAVIKRFVERDGGVPVQSEVLSDLRSLFEEELRAA